MSITKESVKNFLGNKDYIFYGVSANKSKFSNYVFKHLKVNGYNLYPVHPDLNEIEGIKCYRKISEINNIPDFAIIIMNPQNTEDALYQLFEAGVKNVWIQQRSESEKSIKFCEEKCINIIYGECILMFIEPTGIIHRVHKWINGIAGKLPA